MSTAINQSVDKIADGLSELASHLSQPDALHLLGTHQAMERLHEVLPLLSNINVAFAYVCERDKAGTLVGANHAVEYLTERLGMSRSQAFNLLEQARLIWGKPNVPEPEPAEDTDEAERKRQEEEAARRRREAEEAQERARRAAAQASEEKKRIITQALKQLNEHADPGAETIMAQALEAADTMTPEELRKYVTNLVSRANKKGKDYEGKKDPLAAWKKRGIWLGAPDADGGSELKGYLDAASRALLEAALAAGDHLGSNMDGADAADRDTRRKHQRRCDQLDEILRRYGSASSAARGGVGTVVITLTLEDLLGADAYTQFTTNTSVSLTPIDIVRLGLAGDSFLLQLDSATGVPLSFGRARFASVGQRLALLAMQGVCAWNGCTKPGVELEAHHLESFLRGGLTSIDNMILLCREHHMCNNDARNGEGNKGYFDRDPDSGDVIYQPAGGGPPRRPTTYQYQESPGQRHAAKARAKHPPTERHRPDPVLFECKPRP